MSECVQVFLIIISTVRPQERRWGTPPIRGARGRERKSTSNVRQARARAAQRLRGGAQRLPWCRTPTGAVSGAHRTPLAALTRAAHARWLHKTRAWDNYTCMQTSNIILTYMLSWTMLSDFYFVKFIMHAMLIMRRLPYFVYYYHTVRL